jgi:outer membrane receptor protein involved in Fe transport
MRAALAFQVSDDVKITPSIFYQTTRANNSSQFTENLSDPSAGQFNDSRLMPETSEDRAILPTLKIEWHPEFADLTATTSYWHRHLDVIFDATGSVGTFGIVNYGNPLGPDFPSSPADFAAGLSPQYEKAFTQEVRLASKQEGFVTWVTGIFYDHRDQSDVYALFSDLINPVGTPILYDYQLNADDQLALYANLDFHFTKQLTLSLGERIAKVKTEQINTAGGQLNAGVPDVTTSASETPSLPRAVISYQVDPANMVYFSAGRGFRVGGGNAALPLFCGVAVPPSYNPDSDWSFEVGAKDQLFGGKLQIDSSVFHVIWSQIQQEISVGTCGGLPYIANAGQAIVNGFDLALQALVTDNLRVNLSAGYSNAYFDETVFNSPGSPLVVSGDKVGYPPQVNPPWDIDATANYDYPLPNSAKLYLRAEDQYHSHNPGPFRTQLAAGPGYFPELAADPATNLVNVRLGYVRDKVDVSLFMNNALNSDPLLGKFLWSSSSALVAYDTFRPRTVGLTANYKF